MPEKKIKSEKLSSEVSVKKPVASKVRAAVSAKRVTKTRKASLSEAVGQVAPRPKAGGVKAKTQPQPSLDKVKKERKAKLIRDSFKFPELEYRAFEALKSRCLAKGYAAKKSELVRAGLLALAAMTDEELLKSVSQVEKLKTGRPSS